MWTWILALVAAAAALAAWRRLRPRAVATLTLQDGEGPGLEFPLTSRPATIGTEDGGTVVVSDPRVSRLHATLSLEDGDYILRDRSRRGTTVNGAPVKEAKLHTGDVVRLADSVDLVFTRLR